MRATRLGLVLLVGLSALSAWWLSSVTREPVPSVSPRGPDWYFDDATLTAMDAGGQPSYRLHARSIVHAPDGGSAHGDDVSMDWLQGEAMRMHAASARVSADGVTVMLDGGVRIVDETATGTVVLETSSLAVDTAARTARSRDAVTVSTTGGTLEAVGLFVDSRNDRILFEREVRGHYVH